MYIKAPYFTVYAGNSCRRVKNFDGCYKLTADKAYAVEMKDAEYGVIIGDDGKEVKVHRHPAADFVLRSPPSQEVYGVFEIVNIKELV